jgi:hypothetical protein
MTRPRASDRLSDRASFSDPEFLAWCETAIVLWRKDQALQLEFLFMIDFFDWAFDVAESLIRSADKNSRR